MITAEQGYKKALQVNPGTVAVSCLEFPGFFLYVLKTIGMDLSDVSYSGTMYDAIDKKTGKHFYYDITSDINAYRSAKKVDLKTVMDIEV